MDEQAVILITGECEEEHSGNQRSALGTQHSVAKSIQHLALSI